MKNTNPHSKSLGIEPMCRVIGLTPISF